MATSNHTETYGEDWPVIWRVVAAACASYDHDMVMLETESKEEAVKKLRGARSAGWPVRMEKVRCGRLPDDYLPLLTELRGCNAQNPGTSIRSIPGAWSKWGAA